MLPCFYAILFLFLFFEVPNANFTAGTVVVLSKGPRPENSRKPGSRSSCMAGLPLTGEKGAQVDPDPQGQEGTWTMPFGPVLERAQDSLQVFGREADDCLNIQLGLLQRLLLYRELVALYLHKLLLKFLIDCFSHLSLHSWINPICYYYINIL